MDWEKQKAVCAEYAQKNGGSVADVIRTSGRKGAVIISKDGRILYDPFVLEQVKEVIAKEPLTKMADSIKERPQGEVSTVLEAPKPAAQRKKPGTRKK